MKRFLSLLALVAAPALGMAADAQMAKSSAADKMKDCCSCGPVSAMDECWGSRTYLKVGFSKSTSPFYSLNTIQPLYRDASMDNTVFLQAGIGMQKWHRSTADVGLGYRHLLASGEHMIGASLFYFDNTHLHHKPTHSLLKKNGLGADVSWWTQYTTLSLGRYHNVHKHMNNARTWKKFVDFNKSITTLDLDFQVPFMPWAQVSVGKTWSHHYHGFKKSVKHSLKKLDYALKLNIAGPLAIEAGYNRGWNNSGYVNFVLTFGRPAVREHTLMDGFIADEAMTPRDLRNYTLDPVSRALI